MASENPEKAKEPTVEGAAVTLTGTVEKIIPAIGAVEPEKVQIKVETADELYQEIRIENSLKDEDGNPVVLKKGAEVEVKIAADADAVKPKE